MRDKNPNQEIESIFNKLSENVYLKFFNSNEIYCEQHYFQVVLLIMLYKVFLTFESVDEIQKCDH